MVKYREVFTSDTTGHYLCYIDQQWQEGPDRVVDIYYWLGQSYQTPGETVSRGCEVATNYENYGVLENWCIIPEAS